MRFFWKKAELGENILSDHSDPGYSLAGTKKLGVVLVHGWSAMPNQVRSLAEKINQLGYFVEVPRLRGHGTVASDLSFATSADWTDDVVSAIKRLKNKNSVAKVIVCGVSLGGNLGMIASTMEKVDGLIFLGAPIYLKNHFWIWLVTRFFSSGDKFVKKKYPKGVYGNGMIGKTSYQAFPLFSVRQLIRTIRKAVFSLKKVEAPLLIIQSSSDYMVAKYSPWLIYNLAGSKDKQLFWVKTTDGNHNLVTMDFSGFFPVIKEFIEKIEKK